jgi:hemerythrin
MNIQWTEDLAVGVSIIDRQHQELFNRINQLFSACSKGKGKEEIRETLKFLNDYVIFHFGEEEKIMTEHNYPDYPNHKAQHEFFTKSLEEIKEQFEAKGPTVDLVIRTNRFLTDWLINHIRKIDKVLGSFLKR